MNVANHVGHAGEEIGFVMRSLLELPVDAKQLVVGGGKCCVGALQPVAAAKCGMMRAGAAATARYSM